MSQVEINGTVKSISGKPIPEAMVSIKGTDYSTISDKKGRFRFEQVSEGEYTLYVLSYGQKPMVKKIIVATEAVDVQVVLQAVELDEVDIHALRIKNFGQGHLDSIDDFGIYEGKKTEVILIDELDANLATNNPRQVYAKITGLNIWESDGAGLQLGIGGRGLNPNRTSNFNVRQNGYDISADALGYPESYYTPPTEALEKIEITRGAASLQYGTQFGGVVNFKLKKGAEDKKAEVTMRQSIGSWGFSNTFVSVGGTVADSNLNYYSFVQYRQGDGFRPNSQFDAYNAYAAIDYRVHQRLDLNLEYTKMYYLAQQPGGLTDRNFEYDPRQSLRERNWFTVDWNLFALTGTYRLSKKTQINTRFFGLLAKREAIGNLERINVIDFGEERTLIRGQFQNIGNETRVLHEYRLGKRNHNFLAGVRLYHGRTISQQGDASDGSDADFTFLNPDDLENSDYVTPNDNIAIFAENIFNITEKFTVTPGLRYEHIHTFARGFYKQRVINFAGQVVAETKIEEDLERRRGLLIAGLGLNYDLNKDISIYANYSQNYRAINFSDLRIVNPNFQVDPDIQDERGFTADLGIKGTFKDAFNFELTGFYLAYRDRIGQLLLANQPPLFLDYRFRTNIADARNIGVEFFGEIDVLHCFKKLDHNDWSWTIFANTAVVDAVYVNTEDNAIKDRKVEMVPPLLFRTGTSVKYKKLGAAVQFAHTEEHFTDATNAVRTSTAIEGIIPTYQVMDISVNYTYKWMKVEGSINNALNELYFTRRADGYPGPGIIPSDGRAFYLTFQAKF